MDLSKITRKQWLIGGAGLFAVLAVLGSQSEPQPGPINSGGGGNGGMWGSGGSNGGGNDGGGNAGASGSSSAPVSNSWTKYTIMDVNGFGGPIPSATINVPPGWRAGGVVMWNGTNICDPENPARHVVLASADGTQQIQYLPGMAISTYPSGPPSFLCVGGVANSGDDLIRQFVAPRFRRNWSVQSVSEAAIPAALQQQAQAMQGRPYAFDAVLVSPDGSTYELLQVAGQVNASQVQAQGMASPVLNQVMRIRIVRGPRESLSQLAQMAEEISNAAQIDPQWGAQIHQHRMALINGGKRLARPNPNSGNPASAGEVFPGDATGDRIQRRTVDGIREVQRCYNPDTRQTEEVSIHVNCDNPR